jgi:hypothetical protein
MMLAVSDLPRSHPQNFSTSSCLLRLFYAACAVPPSAQHSHFPLGFTFAEPPAPTRVS